MDYESILEKQFENVLEGENFSGISEEAARLSEGLSDPFTLENVLQATLEQRSLFQSSSMIDSLNAEVEMLAKQMDDLQNGGAAAYGDMPDYSNVVSGMSDTDIQNMIDKE